MYRFKAWKVLFIASIITIVPAISMAFDVGDLYNGKPSVRYSRHNLSALNQIEPALGAGVIFMEGNAYDNYGEICVYCHTPHNPNPDKNAPLWNRPTSLGNHSTYNSYSLDVTRRKPEGRSLACLSCHDGTIAVDSVLNFVKITDPSTLNQHFAMKEGAGGCGTASCHASGALYDHSRRFFGTDLRNIHPISVDYNEAYTAQSPTEFADPATISPLKLFNGRVECPTCHDVHQPTDPYDWVIESALVTTKRSDHLRRRNSSSLLCRTCHLK